MDKQIQKLNDESVAQTAIDHPCMHEWLSLPHRNYHVCKICEFEMTNSEHRKYEEIREEKSKV